MQPVLVVIQARTGSSRLPGKVLVDMAGRPMLRFQLDRLARLEHCELVVATSDLPSDDPIEALALDAGVAVVRGSETDVLARFAVALDRFDPTTVVRLTGDCPLSDPSIVASVVELHHASGADYTSNVHPRSFPQGLDVEVAAAPALRAAATEAVDPYDREHVTPFLYQHPERFATANLSSGHDLGHLGWTVDTADDLARVRALVRAVDDPVAAAWTEILAAAGGPAAGDPNRVAG
jgi:spore coat polysaccharide biosynthesis protein SpsF